MKWTNFSFALLLFLCINAHSQGPADGEKIMVDPSAAMGGLSSQLFDSVGFIPLETTKASLFGSIWKMEVMGDYFVIGDQDTRSILVFQKDGKFISRIDKSVLKGDPGLNFTVDPINKLIITRLVNSPRTLFWLDLRGNIIRQESFNDIVYSVGTMGDSVLLIGPWNYSEKAPRADSMGYAIKYIKDQKVVRELLPVAVRPFRVTMTTSLPRPNYFYSSGQKDSLIFVGENYDYTIRVLNGSGLGHVYKLVFPRELSLPPDFLTNNEYRPKEEQFLKENLKMITGLRNVYLMSDHLFFETINSTFLNNNRYLSYDLRTAQLLSLERITSDGVSYFLPLLTGQPGSIVGCDGKSLYSVVSSLELFQAKEANKSKQPNYPPVLQQFFSSQGKDSNPVLVKLRFKANR